jgi:hypothetical protein
MNIIVAMSGVMPIFSKVIAGTTLTAPEMEQLQNSFTKIADVDFGAIATTLSELATALSDNISCITDFMG